MKFIHYILTRYTFLVTLIIIISIAALGVSVYSFTKIAGASSNKTDIPEVKTIEEIVNTTVSPILTQALTPSPKPVGKTQSRISHGPALPTVTPEAASSVDNKKEDPRVQLGKSKYIEEDKDIEDLYDESSDSQKEKE